MDKRIEELFDDIVRELRFKSISRKNKDRIILNIIELKTNYGRYKSMKHS